MSLYFKSPAEVTNRLSALSQDSECVMAILNAGLSGGQTAVHASSKGLRITMFGKTIAKGRTPRELAKSFAEAREKARQQVANEQTH